MRRLLPFLGAMLVVASVLSATAAADTFRIVRPHANADAGATVIPFTATQTQNGPMSFAALSGIWQAAGSTYGIPWQVLAAINKVETDFGSNLGPSSAGAVGWMQFMPSTWARWGIDANGDGVADPDNPTDAIFSAARYLAGCGGQFDIARAVYCYNHSQRYVTDVLGLASLYGRGGGVTGLFSVDLRPQLDSARHQIAGSKSKLAAARARATKLAGAERRLLHEAGSAHLLSSQLEARKRAVLMDVRRSAAVARVNRLQRLLDAAHTRLVRLQHQANNPTLGGAGLSAFGSSLGADGGVSSIALQYLGVPYVWAGATPSGFDCSGLVQYVFAQLGVSLPHNAAAQWHSPDAISVPRAELEPGDLVFFNKLDHVGIYIGNGDFIDAPHTGADVRIDSLSGWYAANYDGAKRIVNASLGNQSRTTVFAANEMSFTPAVVYFTH